MGGVSSNAAHLMFSPVARQDAAALTRIERDVDEIKRQMEVFISTHQAKHDAADLQLTGRALLEGQFQQRLADTEAVAKRNDQRLDLVESWRSELLGAMSLVRFTLGASILGVVVSIVSIALLLTGQAN